MSSQDSYSRGFVVRMTFRGWFALFFTLILAVSVLQPAAATAAANVGAPLGSPAAARSGPPAAAPQQPMTLAQRRTQVQTRLGGLSPVLAAARDHAVTKPAAPAVHPKVRAMPSGPWSKASTAPV